MKWEAHILSLNLICFAESLWKVEGLGLPHQFYRSTLRYQPGNVALFYQKPSNSLPLSFYQRAISIDLPTLDIQP